jgi:hypothetical protein
MNLVGIDKAELAHALNEPGELEKYVTKMDGYITAINLCGPRRVKRTDIDTYNTQIVSAKVNQMKMTENVKIFWPAPVLRRFKKQLPPASKLIKAKVAGKQLMGILLCAQEHGFPMGTYRMENVCIDELSKNTNIGDTANEWKEGQMQIRSEAARAKVPGVSVGKRNGETLKTEAEVKRHKKTDSYSSLSVDFMDSVAWPLIQRNEGQVAETATPTKKPQSEGAALGGDGAAREPRSVQSSVKKTKKTEQRLKANSCAEQVLAECKQVFDKMQKSQEFKSIPNTMVAHCSTKVKARLQTLLKYYGYHPSDEGDDDGEGNEVVSYAHKGMEHVANLRECERKLNALSPLVAALNATKGSDGGYENLVERLKQVQLVFDGESMCSYPAEIALKRACKEHAESGDFIGFAAALEFSTSDLEAEASVLSLVPGNELKATLQRTNIQKHLHNVLRSADDKSLERALLFLRALRTIEIVPSTVKDVLQSELDALHTCLQFAVDPGGKIQVTEITSARSNLRKEGGI